ncbi:MAG: hypothetical protein FJZ16_00265 [Candidatus Omnitrophica bacterium]|nr:hypothetical protein [Candidatus Omnitrophota bacterium]
MKRKVELDAYTKMILTLIAIGLFLNFLKDFLRPENAGAIMASDVNLVSISGIKLPELKNGFLPVEIKK